MEHALQEYLHYLQAVKRASPHTILAFGGDLKSALAFFVSQLGEPSPRLEQLTPRLCREFVAALGQRGLAPATIKRRLAALRAWCKWLMRRGSLSGNPTVGVRGPKVTPRLPTVPSSEDVMRLLDEPETETLVGKRDRAVLQTLYSTGMRLGELCALNVGDVDLAARRVRIRHGKGDKERLVFLVPSAAVAIETWLASRSGWASDPNEVALFVNRFGGRIAPWRVGFLLTRYAEGAGLDPKLHPHSLRHAFATHLLQNGSDLVSVSRLLGHANLASTARYTHLSDNDLRRAFLAGHPRARRNPSTKKDNHHE